MTATPVQTSYSDAPALGFPGLLVGANNVIMTGINAEASASIAFGRAVMFKTSSPATDLDVTLPTSESVKIMGIVAYDASHSNAEGGDLETGVGLRVGALMSILRKGRMWVTVEDAVVPGDRLWVRGVAAGDPEFLGGLLPADDGSDTVDCTGQGQFLSTAAAGALALLEVDFTGL